MHRRVAVDPPNTHRLASFHYDEFGAHMSRRSAMLGFAVLACICWAPASLASPWQTVSAADPPGLLKLIQAEGYAATLETDPDGDPIIRMKLESVPAPLIFFGCTGGRSCRTVSFRAGYDIQGIWPLDAVNRCNRTMRWIHCWADDEGDPIIQMDVNLVGGVPPGNFISVFQTWIGVKRAFEKMIDWPQSGR